MPRVISYTLFPLLVSHLLLFLLLLFRSILQSLQPLFVSNLFGVITTPTFSLFLYFCPTQLLFLSPLAVLSISLSLPALLLPFLLPFLLLTDLALWTAPAASLRLKSVWKKRVQTGIEEISAFCQNWPHMPEALHIISKAEVTGSQAALKSSEA